MDCFLYNPPANWIVSYKIQLQMVNWIVYMIYFMSRQHLGAYFPTKREGSSQRWRQGELTMSTMR